ncbi:MULTISPECIES: aldehyde dehydrogenase [Ramlibacter]|uniref:4-(hydroxymethyl)benzenesulfonate dehydrogenase n=1 Tax=Ramlibacter pinisoli TaxID=2682844 RepID=A0A6N8ITS1_9BURK|nr:MULTISPECIES: aldehyde dehydrogenase [Ramlibacter]MBA2964960.1 aldehyde dehydrogenase [Ramlibacter sp. CGMCC 1.13660]MVQ29925.1 aldehyde dehydrogenase family protein [Ramlibacter pinisoli]
MTEQLQTLIAGRWRDASGPQYATEYPHDGSTVATLHAATAADVDEAVQAAEQARRQRSWAGLKRHERAAILHRIAAGIRSRGEELAQLQRLDNGKPVNETRALVASAAGTFQFFAAACETWEDQLTPARGDYLTMSVHEPLGVVGAITPWNSPIASEAQKIAPALAAGCAVVMKPAEITPRMAIELARIAQDAGVPDGILSVLPGKGSIVGDALVKQPLVRRIAFTGGTTVGLGIARLAADKLMPTSLELGGKSPTIVCADADLDHAVKGVLYGIFSSSGESCIAGSRAFVHASVYDAFKARLLQAVQALRVGDPALESTQMGPLVNQGHRASVERYVGLGLEEGGKLLAGGRRPDGAAYGRGSYYLPTVFEGLPNGARMCQEEIFGPVLALLPWTDEADLLAQCNDSVFGLASGIWTRDYKTAWRIGSALQTGTVWINTYKLFSVSTPFGGVKQSGTGREKGRLGILEYTAQKSFYWGLNDAPLPWAD